MPSRSHKTLPPVAPDPALHRPEVREAEFEALFERSPTGQAFVNADGLFLRVNRAFCDLVGYAPSELEGVRTYQDITHPEDVEADAALAAELVDGTRTDYRMQKRYCTKLGRVVWVDLTATAVNDRAGEYVHAIGFVQRLEVPADMLAVDTDTSGHPTLRVKVPAWDWLAKWWKVLAAGVTTVVVPALGTVGWAANEFYAQRAENVQLRKEVERNAADLKQMGEENRRLLDRLTRDMGAVKRAVDGGP